MPSIIPGFQYDIFVSYRHNDNKYDGWVTEFPDMGGPDLVPDAGPSEFGIIPPGLDGGADSGTGQDPETVGCACDADGDGPSPVTLLLLPLLALARPRRR